MPTSVPVITYPESPEMWRKKFEDRERLQIINREDFPLDEMIGVLGLKRSMLFDSFGISDEEEITERHALTGIFLREDGFRRWACSAKIPFKLPRRGEEFLDFYDPLRVHNPYWEVVHHFLAAVNAMANPPRRLREAAKKLREGLSLEDAERRMAAAIGVEVQKATVLAGTMTFVVCMNDPTTTELDPTDNRKRVEVPQEPRVESLTPRSVSLHGHRRFSESLGALHFRSAPWWANERWDVRTWVGISAFKRWQVKRENRRIRDRAYKAMVVSGESKSAVTDIASAVVQRLNKLTWSDRSLTNGEVIVGFYYSEEGLIVHLIDVRKPAEKMTTQVGVGMTAIERFQGLSEDQRKQIEAAREEVDRIVGEVQASRSTHEFRTMLERLSPGILDTWFACSSYEMDKEFKWSAVDNMYESETWRELYAALVAHREFFEKLVANLSEVATVVQAMVDKADELKVPICSPKVESNGHVIGFENLIPIHLIGRGDVKRVVPVTELPELNGNMVGLTGRHGGGKTETQIAVALASWLAHSGLPIFSDRFWFNPKRVLGLALVPKRSASGSTCQMMVKKYRDILRGIKGIEGRHVVLFLDEIGLGTQETSGFELGRDLLATLSRTGVSVLFSTQITTLARHAESNLGAVCFQFNARHEISRGIGDGGMDELRKRSGLDRLLRAAS